MKKVLLVSFALIMLFIIAMPNTIRANEELDILKGVYIKNEEVEQEGKVYVDIDTGDYTFVDLGEGPIVKIMVFLLGNNQYLSAEVKDITTSEPYFIMPKGAVVGKTYELSVITLSNSETSFTYSTNRCKFDRNK